MNKLLILWFWIVLPSCLFAWERKSDTTLYVGIQGGMSYCGWRNFFDEYKHRLLPDYNIFAEFQPTREFSLRGGIGNTTKGISYRYTFYDVLHNPFDTSAFINLNYLTLPFTACYNLGRRFNPYLGVGFELNFLTKSRHFARLPETRNGIEVEPFDNEIKDFYKNFDICLLAEAGFDYLIKPDFVVFIQARYHYSLLSIYKDSEAIPGGNLVKNNAIAINAGIKIGIPIKYTVY
ncbi:MAG TPA: outer membrane beta-barrel protein [Bacteroidales bacterium]|nr:outer membrane beta-barrel protein [Bacteroidales bacterium]HQP03291.1 outer membrane beta-barrel protein [Bacteroidales bacterium]